MKKLLTIIPLVAILLTSPIHAEQSCLEQELLNAVKRNDAIRTKNLAALTNPNISDGSGTLLMKASINGCLEIVKILIQAGADVNAKNNCGQTALFCASAPEVVKSLIQARADVNAKDSYGHTALSSADSLEKMTILIQSGANVNTKDNDGVSPLIYVLNNLRDKEGNVIEVIKLLIQAGANVNERNNYNGQTALLYAIMFHTNTPEVVKTLIQAGADVNAKNKEGETALFYCCEDNDTATVLIQAGADINAKDFHGNTPLIVASLNHHNEIVKTLIQAGADVNIKNKDGETALFIAADRASSLEDLDTCIKALVDAGTNGSKTIDKDGRTVLILKNNSNVEVFIKIDQNSTIISVASPYHGVSKELFKI